MVAGSAAVLVAGLAAVVVAGSAAVPIAGLAVAVIQLFKFYHRSNSLASPCSL